MSILEVLDYDCDVVVNKTASTIIQVASVIVSASQIPQWSYNFKVIRTFRTSSVFPERYTEITQNMSIST